MVRGHSPEAAERIASTVIETIGPVLLVFRVLFRNRKPLFASQRGRFSLDGRRISRRRSRCFGEFSEVRCVRADELKPKISIRGYDSYSRTYSRFLLSQNQRRDHSIHIRVVVNRAVSSLGFQTMDLAALDVDPVEKTGLWVPKTAFAQLILACDKGFVERDLFGGHDCGALYGRW
jgi:hypothetical protein